jgi:multimeric flavodoxin WrbA
VSNLFEYTACDTITTNAEKVCEASDDELNRTFFKYAACDAVVVDVLVDDGGCWL